MIKKKVRSDCKELVLYWDTDNFLILTIDCDLNDDF